MIVLENTDVCDAFQNVGCPNLWESCSASLCTAEYSLPVVGCQRSANTAQTAASSDFVETDLAQQLNWAHC